MPSEQSFAIREIPFGAMGGVYEQADVDAVMAILQGAAGPAGA